MGQSRRLRCRVSAKRTAKAPDSVADHGFVRVSAAVPVVALADPAVNAARTVELLRAAADDGAAVIAFPELGLTGYSVDDLVQQDALLDAALAALDTVRAATAGARPSSASAYRCASATASTTLRPCCTTADPRRRAEVVPAQLPASSTSSASLFAAARDARSTRQRSWDGGSLLARICCSRPTTFPAS